MMRKRKNINYFLILFVVVSFFSIGYAVLSKNLKVSGYSEIKKNTWNIYFDNIRVKDGNVDSNNSVTINSSKDTVNFSVSLNIPGDFYEFTVDVINNGSIDATLDSLVKTPELTASQAKYLNYIIEYDNGDEILVNQLLSSKSFLRLKVRVEYKFDITETDLPETTETLNLGFSLNYKQSNGEGIKINNNGSSNDVVKVVSGTGFNAGDEICIKEECFNVLFSDNESVTMLAKYNLQVGYKEVSSNEYVPLENPSGIQDPLTVETNENDYATLPFSLENYWWDSENDVIKPGFEHDVDFENDGVNFVLTYVYNSESLLYPLVDNYKDYLIKQGVNIISARVPMINDLYTTLLYGEEMGLDEEENVTRYDFLFSSSYLSGSTVSNNSMGEIIIFGFVKGESLSFAVFDSSANFGLRPVIILPKDAI